MSIHVQAVKDWTGQYQGGVTSIDSIVNTIDNIYVIAVIVTHAHS